MILRKIKNKRGVELPFEWIFAMIAGGVILFIAIYAATGLFHTGSKVVNTQIATEFKALLDPYETGLASGKSAEIHFSSESRIKFKECSYDTVFGRETVTFSQKSFGKWTDESVPVEINNKYVFSDNNVEGKSFYVFSKPFFMGFKVADLIVINTQKYCFYQAPDEIKEEIGKLNLGNVNFSDSDCSGIKICFDTNINEARRIGCGIVVVPGCSSNCETPYDSGIVYKYDESGKQTDELNYINSLLYAAIFSSKDIYECNVHRLMKKYNELGKVYMEKAMIVAMKGCGKNSDISGKISNVMLAASQLRSSDDLAGLDSMLKETNNVNRAEGEGCRLYEEE